MRKLLRLLVAASVVCVTFVAARPAGAIGVGEQIRAYGVVITI